MTPDEIIQKLDEVGDWTSDKVWEQNTIAAEVQRVIKRLIANHRDVVETKRRTDERLRIALAALQSIYNISGDGFERATHEGDVDA
jgi:hypothetical protein